MGTRIAFAGGESILVTEDLEAVVSSLEGHTADTPGRSPPSPSTTNASTSGRALSSI
ncbi:MAG: hypothetical protein WKF94_14545 [Solirubrobacteraceae bacterium]